MKAAARALFLAGAVAIGCFLVRATPREVTLVYGLRGEGAPRVLEVEIDRGGEPLRRTELRLAPGATQASHRVRLPDGPYHLRLALRDAGAWTGRDLERDLTVSESGTVVLPLE